MPKFFGKLTQVTLRTKILGGFIAKVKAMIPGR